MDLAPFLLIYALAIYGGLCARLGTQPDVPLWLRWPAPIWDWIAHRRPAPTPARADHEKIARLERELSIGEERP